jgi:hypothetical protein
VSYVWIYTARLVTGSGLPSMVPEFASAAAVIFAVTTSLRIWLRSRGESGEKMAAYVPGGIAVAVGKRIQDESQYGLTESRDV